MDIKKIKVENMESVNGNTVPNQFIIRTDAGTYFQSYQTVIAFEDVNGTITLDADSWHYSATTLKYLKAFLNCEQYSKKDIQKMIDDGKLLITDLN